MKAKLRILLITSFSLLLLSWCSSNKEIEEWIHKFWQEQVQKCKENVKFYFKDFFEWNKYCWKETATCNKLIELQNIMWDNCEEIWLETQQLIQDLFYDPYYSAPY